MINDDDLLPWLDDYFRSGAAQKDMEAIGMGKIWLKGEQVEWLTRPVPGGYLQGIVIKPGQHRIGIAVQSPKTGEWKPKWAEPNYLRRVS